MTLPIPSGCLQKGEFIRLYFLFYLLSYPRCKTVLLSTYIYTQSAILHRIRTVIPSVVILDQIPAQLLISNITSVSYGNSLPHVLQ